MRLLAKAALAATVALASVLTAALAQEDEAPESPAAAPPIASTPIPDPAPAPPAPRPRVAPPSIPAAPAPPAPVAAPVPTPAAPPAIATTPAPAQPASGARLSPGQPIPAAELEAFLDGVVTSAMARDHIAGVTVSVVQNGQVTLKRGYGFADLEQARPVDPDRTLFRIGSISKTFTWIALMREVEAGRIRLDAPVNLYLPQRLHVRDQGFSQQVLVRHLMDHSAGFEDRALGQLFERRPERERPLEVYLQQERPRRVAAPGTYSSYSNYGVGLAGAAIAFVAQRPFEQVVEEAITAPLGLSRTTFREPRPQMKDLPAPMPPALAADLSQGYRWTPLGFQRRDFEYIGHVAPAGSASSTAGDMARYMQLLLAGGTLDGATFYAPRTAQAFMTPLRQTPAGVNGWPHGFIAYHLPGARQGFGHAGATLSFMSNMVVIPELGLGVFVSANTETGARLARDLPGQIVQQFYAAPQGPPRSGSRALLDQAGRFQGYYLATRRARSGLEGFVGHFMSGAQVSVTPDGRLLVASGATPEGPALFAPEGDPAEGRFVAVSGTDRLQFVFRDGRATGFLTSMNTTFVERAGLIKHPALLAALAGLTAIAAAATLFGIFRRMRREYRESMVQGRASLIQNTQAVLWLAALALFGAWASRTADVAQVVYGWPGPMLVIASACALIAAALTLVTLALTPVVWRGGRRVDSWSPLRKLGFTVTALIYLAFSVVLFNWGALTPWS